MDAAKFIKDLPNKVNKSVIEGMETNFQFDISGDTGGQFTVELTDGNVLVHDGFVGNAECTVKASDENLGKLLSGELNPMMAVMTGKVKISNPGVMLKYAKVLGLM
ncbi:MAG: SCP2 sterol-binding domain-containing protein [Saprospiraceae bacterium]|nr:SCP2 sterol-binding domain-containing protein [Saprospiraceae bacterium]